MAALNNTRNLSRRKTLVIGAAGLAAGTILSLGLANAAPSGPDAELIRLHHELQELRRIAEAATLELDKRDTEAESKYPPLPEPFNSWIGTIDKISCAILRERIERCAPHRLAALRQSLNEYKATFNKVRQETGADAAEDAYEAAWDRIGDMQARILKIPAKGPQGVLVKLLVWHSATNAMNRTDWDASFVMSSILDLDRLTGGAIKLPSDVRQEAITV